MNTPAKVTQLRRADTIRADHNEMVKRLAAMPVPPAASIYDDHSELGFMLSDHVAYLRCVVDAIAPVFERCADDAADYGGAKAESFDIVRGGVEDFLAPIISASDLAVNHRRRR